MNMWRCYWHYKGKPKIKVGDLVEFSSVSLSDEIILSVTKCNQKTYQGKRILIFATNKLTYQLKYTRNVWVIQPIILIT